jgi:hypothetical protein
MQPSGHTDPGLGEIAKHGSWLYWVAALSLVNVILIAFKAEFGFAISMGFTDMMTAAGTSVGGGAQVVTIVVSLFAIAVMAVLGYFACRGAVWAFIIGLVLLVGDTLLLLLGGIDAIISIAIHVWAIVSLVIGLRLAIARQNTQPAPPPPAP